VKKKRANSCRSCVRCVSIWKWNEHNMNK